MRRERFSQFGRRASLGTGTLEGMYRQDVVPCPACRAALKAQPGALPVHGCEACGGLWLGPDATVHVMRGLDDAIDHEISKHAEKLGGMARRLPEIDENERICPFCEQSLARVDVNAIRVDSCFTHGSWFDRTELHEVVLTCSKLRIAQREQALTSDTHWGVLWEAIVRVWSDPAPQKRG